MDDYLPIIVGILAAILMFFGFIHVIKQTVRFPQRPHKLDSHMKLREQQWRMDDVRANQKQMIRDQKQKIRDLQQLQRR